MSATDNLVNSNVFQFGEGSDDEEGKHNSHELGGECNENKEEPDDLKLDNKFSNLDLVDFKRIEIKRETRKLKTAVPSKKAFSIEKFTDEITKITEELDLEELVNVVPDLGEDRRASRKKTIRFDNKKRTFQYPKEMDLATQLKEKIAEEIAEPLDEHAPQDL